MVALARRSGKAGFSGFHIGRMTPSMHLVFPPHVVWLLSVLLDWSGRAEPPAAEHGSSTQMKVNKKRSRFMINGVKVPVRILVT